MRQAPSIDAYGSGGFRVSGQRHEGSLLILNDQPVTWLLTQIQDLTPEALAPVFAAGPAVVEFVLLGTGAVQTLPPRSVREALQRAGIGLEFMDTPTAARVYNVLAAEGRRLAAALIAV